MTASITFDQVGRPAGSAGRARSDGLANGARVTITNNSGQPCRCEFWWKPPDDTTAALVQASPSTWYFDPQPGRYGEYAVRLVESEGNPDETEDIKAFGIRLPVSQLLIPALNSRGDFNVNLASDPSEKVTAAAISFQNEPLPDAAAIDYANWWQSQRELYLKVEELAAAVGGATGLFFWDVDGTMAPAGNVFTTWSEVFAAASAFEATADIILFSEDENATFTIPAGTYDCGADIGLVAWGNNYTLEFAEGAVLENLRAIDAGKISRASVGTDFVGTRLNLVNLDNEAYPTSNACIVQDVGLSLYLRGVRFHSQAAFSKAFIEMTSGVGLVAQLVCEDVDFGTGNVLWVTDSVYVRLRGNNNKNTRNDCFLPLHTGADLFLVFETGGDQERSWSGSWNTQWDGAGGNSFIQRYAYARRVDYDGASQGDWSDFIIVPETVEEALNLLSAKFPISGTGLSVIYPAQITANQNNYNPTGWDNADIVFLDADGNYNITGFAAPTGSGKPQKILYLPTLYVSLNLKYLDVASSVENQILAPVLSDYLLTSRTGVPIVYDEVAELWCVVDQELLPGLVALNNDGLAPGTTELWPGYVLTHNVAGVVDWDRHFTRIKSDGFITSTGVYDGGATTTTSGGATIGTTAIASHPGAVHLQLASAASQADFILVSAQLRAPECRRFFAVVRAPSAFAGNGQNVDSLMGFYNSGATRMIAFRYNGTTSVFGQNTDSGGSSFTASYVLTANNWYQFEILIDDTASEVTYNIYDSTGSLVFTEVETGNIPTSDTVLAGVRVLHAGTAAALAGVGPTVDYCEILINDRDLLRRTGYADH